VDHQFWRNIVQLPRHALGPTLEASTASTRIKRAPLSKGYFDEISHQKVNFDRNVLNIKLSKPLGFDLYLPV
jgi:hypothetical protein